MPRKRIYPQFGTVSHGTLRSVDLLDSFADELDYQSKRGNAPNKREARRLINEARRMLRKWDDDEDEPEFASELVNELQDALDECAAPYSYFGNLEGDGTDFGFWPSIERLEDDARDGEILKVNDLVDVEPGYHGQIMLVTDHGNVTYGYTKRNGRFVQVWSCV